MHHLPDDRSALEEDYQPATQPVVATRTLPGTSIELVERHPEDQPPRRPRKGIRPIEHVLFDFDGTLSLIREGWVEVMAPMMVEVLQATGTGESPEALDRLVRDFVAELTGKQTIYQMFRLAEEVRRRGGEPRDPLDYKRQYHDRLMERIAHRREALRRGRAAPEEMLVPGSLELLEELCRRGVELHLASGTDEPYVVEEAALLGLDRFFGDHVYGARDDHRSFSKALVIERLLADRGIVGGQLLGFGDGYVEIRNVKQVGGTAVGVASDEAGRSGRPDEWKRRRLLGAGADLIVPDYLHARRLVEWLWGED